MHDEGISTLSTCRHWPDFHLLIFISCKIIFSSPSNSFFSLMIFKPLLWCINHREYLLYLLNLLYFLIPTKKDEKIKALTLSRNLLDTFQPYTHSHVCFFFPLSKYSQPSVDFIFTNVPITEIYLYPPAPQISTWGASVVTHRHLQSGKICSCPVHPLSTEAKHNNTPPSYFNSHKKTSFPLSVYCHVFLLLVLFLTDFSFSRFYLFTFRKRVGEGERDRNISVWEIHWPVVSGTILTTPPTGNLGPQPRLVPWLGIKLVTSRFAGRHSVYWATPARADFSV